MTSISACGAPPPAPQPGPVIQALDRAAVIAALDYWRDAVGITYIIKTVGSEPRLLIRPGTDGLAVQGGGRGGPDGSDPDTNQLTSGIVVIEPGGGQYCRGPAWQCRYLYRHEIGHALGFFGHSGLPFALMQAGSDELTDREKQMMLALYTLPHGAQVSDDGTWRNPLDGSAGTLDLQVARDIVNWNMLAPGGRSFRRQDAVARWELPVEIFLVDQAPQ